MRLPFELPEGREFDAVGFGLNAVDHLLVAPEYPAFDTKTRLIEHERSAGGQTASAMVALQRLGRRTAYAGRFGSDGDGRFGLETLRTEGVDISRAETVEGARNQIAYIIIDAKSLTLFMPSLYPPVQAASIRELAGKLGLDPDALEATVDGFNRAVRPGTFDDKILDDCRTEGLTPPKSHWARRIDTAPFYAYPVRPGITFTYLGTRVNKEARMLMQDGTPAANMFAAGEIMAGNVLGRGYAAGIGMTIGSVFGRIAGREAAANARR